MGFWDVVGLVIAGVIVGSLARLVLPGKQSIGMPATIGVGIVGTLVGYAIAARLGVEETRGVDWLRWIISIVVSVLLVALVTAFLKKKGGAHA